MGFKSVKEVQEYVNDCYSDYLPPTKEEIEASIDEENLSLLIGFLSREYDRGVDYDNLKTYNSYNLAFDILYNKYLLEHYDDGFDFYDDLVVDLKNMIIG